MAKNEQTYTIKIDAELQDLQGKVQKAKQSLDGLFKSGQAPKGLISAFEKIESLLGRIGDKSAQSPSKGLFSSLEKDISNAGLLFGELTRAIQGLENSSKDIKIELFPPEERAKIKNAIEDIKKYSTALDVLEKKRAEVSAAEKALNKAQKDADTAKKTKSSIKRTREKKEVERAGIQGQIDVLGADPEKNAAKIAKLNAEIGKLDLEIKNLTTDYNTASKELTAANKIVESAQGTYNNLSKALSDMETEELEKLPKTFKQINGETAAESIERVRKETEQYVNGALDKLPKEVAEANEGLKDHKETLENVNNELKKSSAEYTAYTDKLEQSKAFEGKIKQFLGLSGAAQVMRSALRDAMNTITELDAVMGEMAVVTDLTVGDYWKQLPEYADRASALGVSITDAYEAATLYYQQGLKTNEVTALSEQTLKMAAIAGLDAADATDRMTAALRGFNMELNEANAQNIADVYSELAAITAADVDEISTAMTKTASIASSAGMEFETTAAFLSQIIETTRESAETAGTAMKTVIARFQELKKSPDEIGEVDGEIVDANAIETALRSVGVALRDSSGQFRELDDVFLELSSKWDGLDKNTQRYIATIAAGSRQQSRFIAMMSDYKRTTDLVTAANNSAGASQRQFEKTAETLGFKINRLKNAWHEFTMGIMNSDLVKTGVDILTKFVEIINKATSGFQGLGGSITKIIGIVAVFNIGKTLYEKLSNPINNFFLGELPKMAYESGKKSMASYQQGAQDQANGKTKEETTEEKPEKTEEKKTLLQKTKDKTGISTLQNAFSKKKELQAGFDEQAKKKQRYESANEKYDQLANTMGVSIEEQDAALEELVAASDEYNHTLDKTEEEQKKLLSQAQDEGWGNIAKGLGEMGQAAQMTGLGMSALGGILSSMGLEEFGEGLATAGNYVTMFGSVLMTLPAIFKIISAVATATGVTISTALWMVTLIVAAIAIVAGTLFAIYNSIKKNSPEGKLKAAQESADKAAEAADNAKESYENLSSAMDGLKDHYKTLDELTKGTKEWNEQLRKTNSAVMDLIKDYPELAQFVSNRDGVLTIDMDSKGVQDVLNKAYEQTITTANLSVLADTKVNKAQNDVDYKNLDNDLKLGYKDSQKYAMAGTLSGMGVGAAVGSFAGPVGAMIGAAVGGLAAGFGAEALAKATHEQARKDTDMVAKAVASGTFVDKESDEYKKLQKDLKLTDEAMADLAKQVEENEGAYRQYGADLIARKQQEDAAYDSLASSVVSLVDTMGKSEEQIKQMYNLADGEAYDKLYKEMESKFDDVDFRDDSGDGWGGIKEASGLTDEQVAEAFERAGFKNAEYSVDTGKITYDDGNTRTSSDISKDQMVRIFSDYWATEGVTKKAEDTPAFTNKLITDATSKFGPEVGEALAKALQDESGKNLTQADITALSKITDWDTLVSGTGYTNFTGNEIKGKVSTKAATRASGLYTKSSNMLNDLGLGGKFTNISAGALESFATKLTEASTKANGEANAQAVAEQVEQIIQEKGLDATQQESLIQRINLVDWSNAESWLAFQLDLEKTYGYSKEKAEEYKNALIDATWATSSLSTTIKEFGELYKATKAIEKATQEITQAQWEYERALKGSGNVEEATAKLIAGYQAKGAGQKGAYDASIDNLSTEYARGANIVKDLDLRKYVTFNDDGSINEDRWQELIDSGKLQGDDLKAANEWLQSLNTQYDNSQDALSGLQDTLSEIEALEQEGKDAYYELRDMAKEAILASLQEQIDLQQQQLDATNEARNQLVNKIQEQINEQRQDRQNAEAVKNIEDLRAQQAQLGMDTSGGNALEMLGLQEQIARAEQDYQDSLIDQSIQSLQDANAEAAEQRERQIALAESQLNIYENSAEFQANIDRQLDNLLHGQDADGLGQLIEDHFTAGLSAGESADWRASLGTKIAQASGWVDGTWNGAKTDITNAIATINTSIGQLGEALELDAQAKKILNQQTTLNSKGFDTTDLTEDQLNKLTAFTEKEGSADSITEKITKLGALGVTNLPSQATHYSGQQEAALNGEGQTYEEMLGEKLKNIEGAFDSILGYSKTGVTGLQEIGTTSGDQGIKNAYSAAFATWKQATGLSDENLFKQQLQDRYQNTDSLTGQVLDVSVDSGWHDDPSGDYDDDVKYTINGTEYTVAIKKTQKSQEASDALNALWNGTSGPPKGALALYKGQPYAYRGNKIWGDIRTSEDDSSLPTGFLSAIKKKLATFKTGGLADFTGPAWLDGTPSRPEYILNAQQTERFFSLIDVLESFNANDSTPTKSGDNYFDINIQVDKLENDYDVEQMADKIRRMIYEDASYRNVNAINHIR